MKISSSRTFSVVLVVMTSELIAALSVANMSLADERPNILWISCEDISPNLACYGDPHAITPNLDSLAREGVRFTRAFTPAGVCAVVRSGVITGMYPPSIGSQHMRSLIIPPAKVKAFPEWLRMAGYFTTNRDKTDYQFQPTPSIWDRQGSNHSDWRERDDKKQPFFSVINLTMTHESQVRHSEQQHKTVIEQIGDVNQHDPNIVADTLPKYLPDTVAARKDWAWYQDNITLMDKQVGEILNRLDEDGLTDSTLVVFWSDHGMGLPRGKRWLYDSGTHVPVIMRWPDKLEAGHTREDLVSALDLPPTMLAIANVQIPSYMHGRTIIGAEVEQEPSYLFFHRDRMDEAYELQRGARDRRWKYIRNYQTDKPYAQHIEYMDAMPTMQDWRRLAATDGLSGGQMNWFAKTKPIEELYDTEKDPWELNNLAGLNQYQDRLTRMRMATEAWQDTIDDTGMIPEAVLMEEMTKNHPMPQTAAPEIEFIDGHLQIRCGTEGASIVYREVGEQGGTQTSRIRGQQKWRLYTKSFPAPKLRIEVLASRLGYSDSPTASWPKEN